MAAEAFFDTSVLIYLLAANDSRTGIAQSLLAGGGVISVQLLNEFAAVARRKTQMSWEQIEQALADIRILCEAPVGLTTEIHEAGLSLAERYGFHVYDALIVASALYAGCKVLYSEDMQDGQIIGSLTIQNPFRTK
jgi:predicted nucleic acid-binding protein